MSFLRFFLNPVSLPKRASVMLRVTLVAIFLIACRPAQATLTPLPFFPTHTSGPQLLATADEPSPTSPQVSAPRLSPMTPSVSTLIPSSPAPATPMAFDPSQLVEITLEPFSLIDWRPPLYPTPWAPTPYDHFYFASPIAADEINIPVQDYRYGGMYFQNVVHTGVDIPAPKYTPVHAAGAGTVTWAGYGVYRGGYDPSDPYGLAVTIQHDFGYKNQTLYTIYGHLDQIDVAVGQHVETGDRLGRVGDTGHVTGPHLHFEVRVGENSYFTTRNPELWLVPPIGWGIIAGRVMDGVDRPIYDQMFIIKNLESEENSFAWSYGQMTVNSDEYYQENLVVGDLPAGTYQLRTAFWGRSYYAEIEVYPGMVSYFTLRGYYGITIEPPPAPGAVFTPLPP